LINIFDHGVFVFDHDPLTFHREAVNIARVWYQCFVFETLKALKN